MRFPDIGRVEVEFAEGRGGEARGQWWIGGKGRQEGAERVRCVREGGRQLEPHRFCARSLSLPFIEEAGVIIIVLYCMRFPFVVKHTRGGI